MADRYQERPFPSDADHDRGANPTAPAKAESDPLAELARLIGQTDPFGSSAKPPHPLQSRANVRPQYDAVDEEEVTAPAGPPPWMQRARHEAPTQPEYEAPEPEYQPSPVHPLHRYAAQQPAAHEQDYHEPAQQYAVEPPVDPSRYDDALYGQLESGQQEYARDPAFPDDPYAYQSDYEEEPEPKKRSNGLVTVAAVLALAVVGTGAAFAYRTYVGSPRSGEPPIIKADNSPTKVMATPGDGASAKTPDRMVPGDGGEKIVSREETPVDVNSKSGPRVVFPPLNQNGSPPPVASVSPAGLPPASAGSGTLPNNEPRKVRTLPIKGDADTGGVPAGVAAPAKPAPAARAAAPAPAPVAPVPAPAPRNPSSANASANGPLSLTPQGGAAPDPAPTHMAATNPVQTAPPAGGGYLVQVSSQTSEADAKASYKMLQGKYPAVLGSRSASIRRAEPNGKVVYRSMVGPFGSQEEANQLCGSLKTAGGQCVILRN